MFLAVTTSRSASAQVENTPDLSDADSAGARVVTASEPARPTAPRVPKERYWYGYQTLLVDAASITTALLGVRTDAPALGYIGALGLFVGAPIVHFVNERPLAAFGSAGLRVGLSGLGVVIGFAVAGSCHEDASSTAFGSCFLHGVGEAAIGGLIGLGSAIVLDGALLARGERDVARSDTGMPRVTSLAPTFDPHTRTAGAGVGGSF